MRKGILVRRCIVQRRYKTIIGLENTMITQVCYEWRCLPRLVSINFSSGYLSAGLQRPLIKDKLITFHISSAVQ